MIPSGRGDRSERADYAAAMMMILFALGCGAGTLRCTLDDAASGEMVLDIDGEDWTGPLSWQLAGDSLQLNADESDGQWVTAVGQETSGGLTGAEGLDDLPAAFDLSDGGWAVLYTASDSDRSASGTLEVLEEDGDQFRGCIAFTTEAGVSASGSFSATSR